MCIRDRAFADLTGDGARPGGAELVYLRLSDGPGSSPRVFAQASLDDLPFPLGAPEPEVPGAKAPPASWVHQRLEEAAEIIRSERHEARVGPGCRYCPFTGSCPAQAAGRQVVR